jgi:hypothetical protein
LKINNGYAYSRCGEACLAVLFVPISVEAPASLGEAGSLDPYINSRTERQAALLLPEEKWRNAGTIASARRQSETQNSWFETLFGPILVSICG